MIDPIALLAELVRIPSVNPMGRDVSGPDFLETRLTAYLESWFAGRGISVERDEVSPGRVNLLARYDAPGSRRTILWDVHQDTVPTDGMTIDPFGAEVDGGKMYGRGTCDVKGSMAGMLAAFDRLCRERPAGSASVILACTVDEEFTHTGSSRLAERIGRGGVDLAIVAEPTRFDVVRSHKGAVRWAIRTKGRSCHSSTPHLGVNAVYRMGPVLAELSSFADELAGRTPDPWLGPPSLSVGRIEGGQSVNSVPEWCRIEIDRRLIPGESPSDAMTEVAEHLRRAGLADTLEHSPPWVRMPALSPRSGEDWLGLVSDALAPLLPAPPKVIGVPFGTDAGPLSEVGIPSLVLGPGDIAQAHTADEWVELDQIRIGAEAYYTLACALG